jgi:hypothetical protein
MPFSQKAEIGIFFQGSSLWGSYQIENKTIRTMRSTEWLPASRLLLGFVPHPAGVAPRAAIGDRGRWARNTSSYDRVVQF